MFVCNMITFESPDLESSFWYAGKLHYHGVQMMFVYGSYGQGQSHRRKNGLYVDRRPKYHRSSLKGELKIAQKLRPDTLSQQIRARTIRRDLDHNSCAWRGKSRYSIRKNLASAS